MEQRNWIATEETESKEVIPFWTAETCNFSPVNVSFRHQPEKLPVSDLNCREKMCGTKPELKFRSLRFAGDTAL